jgi:hypothetical protein
VRKALGAAAIAIWAALATAQPAAAATVLGIQMPEARAYHFAVPLANNGNVLIGGGSDGRTELSDVLSWVPDRMRWRGIQPLSSPRSRVAAVALPGGTVVIAGGFVGAEQAVASTEIFDPYRNSWAEADPMPDPRWGAVAVQLQDGRLLFAGGAVHGQAVASADIFDPATRHWERAAPLPTPRISAAAVVLRDGRVLVAGGAAGAFDETPPLRTTEVYDPRGGHWLAGPPLTEGRRDLLLALLPNDSVIAVGGYSAPDGGFLLPTTTTEVLDRGAPAGRSGPPLNVPRAPAAGTELPDGTIVVAGGVNRPASRAPVTAEVLSPGAGRWAFLPQMHSRRESPAVTAIPGDRVLISGGLAGSTPTASADMYTLSAPNATATGHPTPPSTAMLLGLTAFLALAVLVQAAVRRRS